MKPDMEVNIAQWLREQYRKPYLPGPMTYIERVIHIGLVKPITVVAYFWE